MTGDLFDLVLGVPLPNYGPGVTLAAALFGLLTMPVWLAQEAAGLLTRKDRL